MQTGIDNSEVIFEPERPKSVGNSVTLPRDLRTKEEIEDVALSITEQVCYRLRKNDLLANVVNVQLRTKDFVDISHQKKLNTAVSNTKVIYRYSKRTIKRNV